MNSLELFGVVEIVHNTALSILPCNKTYTTMVVKKPQGCSRKLEQHCRAITKRNLTRLRTHGLRSDRVSASTKNQKQFALLVRIC